MAGGVGGSSAADGKGLSTSGSGEETSGERNGVPRSTSGEQWRGKRPEVVSYRGREMRVFPGSRGGRKALSSQQQGRKELHQGQTGQSSPR